MIGWPVMFAFYNKIFEGQNCRVRKPVLKFVVGQRWEGGALVQRMHSKPVNGIREDIH